MDRVNRNGSSLEPSCKGGNLAKYGQSGKGTSKRLCFRPTAGPQQLSCDQGIGTPHGYRAPLASTLAQSDIARGEGVRKRGEGVCKQRDRRYRVCIQTAGVAFSGRSQELLFGSSKNRIHQGRSNAIGVDQHLPAQTANHFASTFANRGQRRTGHALGRPTANTF